MITPSAETFSYQPEAGKETSKTPDTLKLDFTTAFSDPKTNQEFFQSAAFQSYLNSLDSNFSTMIYAQTLKRLSQQDTLNEDEQAFIDGMANHFASFHVPESMN